MSTTNNALISKTPLALDTIDSVIVGGIVNNDTGEIYAVNVQGQKRRNLDVVCRDEYNRGLNHLTFSTFRFGSAGTGWSMRCVKNPKTLQLLNAKFLYHEASTTLKEHDNDLILLNEALDKLPLSYDGRQLALMQSACESSIEATEALVQELEDKLSSYNQRIASLRA